MLAATHHSSAEAEQPLEWKLPSAKDTSIILKRFKTPRTVTLDQETS